MAILAARDLAKTYVLGAGGEPGLAALFGLRGRHRKETHALRGVSFAVERGESVAVIGKNGSGKSTLLRLLAGLSRPTAGTVDVGGEVGTLIDLGVGFHPDYTGRENLLFAGQIAGFTREEIDARLESIIDFSGLREAIDRPLRTYSSGMTVRLGFAVATAFEPEILLVDEVLAVGDAAFQFRCYERMEKFLAAGGTLVLVSHDMSAVLRMCPRAIWLDRGDVRLDGPAMEVSRAYDEAAAEAERVKGDLRMTRMLKGSGEATIESLTFHRAGTGAGAGEPVTAFASGEPLRARIGISVSQPIPRLDAAISIYRDDGLVLAQQVSSLDGLRLTDVPAGRHVLEMTLDGLCVEPAKATVSVTLLPEIDAGSSGPMDRYDLRSRAWALEILPARDRPRTEGAFIHPCEWTIE